MRLLGTAQSVKRWGLVRHEKSEQQGCYIVPLGVGGNGENELDQDEKAHKDNILRRRAN